VHKQVLGTNVNRYPGSKIGTIRGCDPRQASKPILIRRVAFGLLDE